MRLVDLLKYSLIKSKFFKSHFKPEFVKEAPNFLVVKNEYSNSIRPLGYSHLYALAIKAKNNRILIAKTTFALRIWKKF